ncbi:protein tipE [Musca vetustissima]|uniref:protein tipE n=1 Tax=Musca vetustissima TaxID=27455 RepID=UPI002AB7A258|nr:protein tipE [Musca vetustissima]
MADELEIRTLREKLLFYTTAFFILLGTFSMFAFLFLVPFVIEPAFTTIFMQFDEVPALCETSSTITRFGARNCSWSSCREGCTREIFECTQIMVNYRLNLYNYTDEFNFTEYHINLKEAERVIPPKKRTDRYTRAIRDYEYDLGPHDPMAAAMDDEGGGAGGGGMVMEHLHFGDEDGSNGFLIEDSGLDTDNTLISADGSDVFEEISELNRGLMSGNDSKYFFVGAHLYPNVKGCGYPPVLNCTIWFKRYTKLGVKFPCYYSKVDPSVVISELDYWQNTLNLIYSIAIPVPSFIISVIYLTYAYFKIYNEDEETAPLDKNAEDMDIDDEGVDDSDGAALADNAAGSQVINMHDSTTGESCIVDGILPNGGPGMTNSISQPGSVTTPGQYRVHTPGSVMTPNSDMHSFGHQLKVQMADDFSRDSLENGILSTSNSVQGNLSKTMTTSISTPPGPVAAV